MTVPFTNIRKRVRKFITDRLFAREYKHIEIIRELFKGGTENLKTEKEQFEAYKASLTVTDLVREQLNGINPRILDTEEDILDKLDTEETDVFLANVKSLDKNPAFKTIIEYLIRDQVLESVRHTENFNAMNFCRATINGFDLVKEEVERLVVLYDKLHEGEEDFNKHTAL